MTCVGNHVTSIKRTEFCKYEKPVSAQCYLQLQWNIWIRLLIKLWNDDSSVAECPPVNW